MAGVEIIGDIEGESKLTPQVLMHLTMIHELAGNRERALQRLQQALKAGFPAKELANEPELTALRAAPRYHRVIAPLPPPEKG